MRDIGSIVVALVCLVCCGCGHSDIVNPPEVKINPSAHERQKFVISITGQSSQIEDIQEKLQYNIANDSCFPMDYGMALRGIKPTFTMGPSLKLIAAKHSMYEGYVYRDQYESSDYYGIGVCRWKLTAIHIYVIQGDGRKQAFMLNGIDLKYGAHSYATCPSGSPKQYSLNCAFSRSNPMELTGDFYTLSITSRRD